MSLTCIRTMYSFICYIYNIINTSYIYTYIFILILMILYNRYATESSSSFAVRVVLHAVPAGALP